MPRKKTILFFPVEAGVAHITRSSAIGQVLKKRGHRVIFGLAKEKHDFIKGTGIKAIPLKPFLLNPFITSIKDILNRENLREFIHEELQVLKHINPDVIVVDFRLSALVSGAIQKIPTVLLTGSGGLPYGCYLPVKKFPTLFQSAIHKTLQKIIWRTKEKYFRLLVEITNQEGRQLSQEDFFSQMTYIVPEDSNYLPAVDSTLHIHYVGAIIWNGGEIIEPKWLKSMYPDGKTIYVSYGGTGGNEDNLIKLCTALTNHEYHVIVSTSSLADPKKFSLLKNVYAEKFLPGLEVCKRVDMLVCHGGYGTLMQGITCGKPFVATPFNPDQLLHSMRLSELGLGKILMKFNPKTLVDIENWNILREGTDDLGTDRIVKAVESVLGDYDSYKRRIDTFNSQASYHGEEKAADIIESINQ